MISVLILTKNEEQDLPGCLESVKWCDDIHVFDSNSNDKTVAIAQAFGAKVTQRESKTVDYPLDTLAHHTKIKVHQQTQLQAGQFQVCQQLCRMHG